MYICVCHAVTDSQIRDLVDQGATSLSQVQCKVPVAGCCGRCEPTAREVIDEHLAKLSHKAAA